MLITKRSILDGKVYCMDLPVTQSELDRWANGELVQNVFPHLSANEREFLISGILPHLWPYGVCDAD